MPELIPMRWPAEWKDPSKLELLKGSPINCLVGDAPPPFPLGGLQFVKLSEANPPQEIVLREGVWPRVLPGKELDAAAAGLGRTRDKLFGHHVVHRCASHQTFQGARPVAQSSSRCFLSFSVSIEYQKPMCL